MTVPVEETPPATPEGVRRGRPPKGAAQLSRAVILDAAVAVADAEGVSAVSMRSVARQLGVDAKSLYNHVEGKDGLLDALAEHVLLGIRLPEPTGVLADDLRAIAVEFRRGALAHPGVAALVLTRQLASVAGLAPIEASLAVLLRAGIEPEEAVHLLRALLAAVVGTLLREVSAGAELGTEDPVSIARRHAVLASSGLPGLLVAAPHLVRCDHDREFDYTVELLVAAVNARLRERSDTCGR
ncbi:MULTISPECIES: TetR family transcriptional regulator [Actinosynnema]|uniref:TetR family transcriptional regulator n=1 Tax=Actinosynnema TaxID=40566 RepID=UPI0020A547C5|nr:TetR family transcriptional regulator [Actinosynnema pretiosum]